MFKESNVKVFITDEYDRFKQLEGNREVLDNRVNAIISSINKIGYQKSIGLVNEKNEVIDGQGRLEACKRLGLPFLYVVEPNIGLDECITMNTGMTNWNLYDKIRSFAAKGKSDYITLLDYASKAEADGMTITDAAMCLSDAVSKNIERPLKEGYYSCVVSSDTLGCYEFIRGVAKILKKLPGGTQYYLPVLVGLYKFELIDVDRMEAAINEYATRMMEGAYNSEAALTELQNIYNFNKKSKHRFRDDYLTRMEKMGARYKN